MLLLFLSDLPFVQHRLARTFSHTITEKLGTEANIDNVQIGLFNSIILTGVEIKDKNNGKLLKANKISAKIKLRSLFISPLTIRTVELYGANINLTKERDDSDYNFQFIIDSLSQKDNRSSKKLDLNIKSIILNRCYISHNIQDKPYKNVFDFNHTAFKDVNASIGFKIINGDSVDIKVRNIAFSEKNGFKLKHGYANASINKNTYKIPIIQLETKASYIIAENINFVKNKKQRFSGTATIKPSTISLKDIQPFVSTKMPDVVFSLDASLRLNDNKLKILNLAVSEKSRNVELQVKGEYSNAQDFNVDVKKLNIKSPLLENISGMFQTDKTLTQIIRNINRVDLQGYVRKHYSSLTAKANVKTYTGDILIDAKRERDKTNVSIASSNLNIGKILSKEDLLGNTSFVAKANGVNIKDFASSIKFSNLTLKKYEYRNITAELERKNNELAFTINSLDSNAYLKAKVDVKELESNKPQYYIDAAIKKFAPHALNLSKGYSATDFSALLNANFSGKDFKNFDGDIKVSNLQISKPDTAINIGNLSLSSRNKGKGRLVSANGNFGEAEINGKFNFEYLARDFLDIINPMDNHGKRHSDENVFDFNVHLKDATIINLLANTSMSFIGKNFLYGHIDSYNNIFQIEASVPQMIYNGGEYSDVGLFCRSDSNNTSMRFHASKKLQEGKLEIESTVGTKGYNLENSIAWNSTAEHKNSGEISQTITFPSSSGGRIESVIHPSSFIFDDATWNISKSNITYEKGKLYVSGLKFNHGENELAMDGVVSKFNDDSLQVGLRNIRIQKILDLVSFDDVQFDGEATGHINISSALGTPRVNASVNVDDFIFNHAHMGFLNLSSHWNNKSQKIDITALIRDNAYSTTINGYLSPSEDYIDLNFGANGTNALFLNDFFPDAMQLSEGRTSGRLRLFGDLHAMNLEGTQIVSGLKLGIEPLGTKYEIKSDTVQFTNNLISFQSFKLYDTYGNYSNMTGSVKHRDLHDFSYNINLEPHNFLAYDRMQEDDGSSFWGAAFVNGQIHVYGSPGNFTTDANVTPQKKTIFVYNADQPESTDNVELLRFRNADATKNTNDSTVQIEKQEEINDVGTDIRLNFNLNITPDAELRVIMDDKAGNIISTHGRGNINAHFYNKGSFEMFGVYGINDGTYKIKLQDLIQKNFILRDGGRISFNGNPLACALNLQAVYTIPAVSLAGISVQGSLRDNSVPVNCVMNITGNALQPRLNFDIDLPSVSADQKQMVRSLIATPEDMNMQAMYLLSVGRFYTYNYDMAVSPQSPSQTSLAMNSFLSSTLSSNINNFLQNIGENNGNWSFGTNLATGNDGWNDMDVEGMFTGRLFKGRLLIDGNLGYRDKSAYNSNFVGDFSARYLLNSRGTIQLKAYNESNDRYFTKSTLTTQGGGIVFKRDFNNIKELFHSSKRKNSQKRHKENSKGHK